MCVSGIAISKYINLYTDFAFKKLFGTEANKDILISFLNTFLEFEDDKQIEDVEYINPEQLGDTSRERKAI
ncbi:MAG: PD-(D/E)XK nuclease family transposase, partial [Bacteroidales bacterium]|nr:PD-(D/E)XK nuclease family transposase [Bacteroidales bacterium]